MRGNVVSTIVDKYLFGGTYTYQWDGKNYSGSLLNDVAYSCCLVVGSQVYSRKMLLLR
jgi:flagellar hook assembly protein FlgD